MSLFLSKLAQKITQNFLYWLYHGLNIKDFECRTLTVGEIQLAKTVFDHLIQYEEVKILNIPYLPWQPNDIFMAPNGRLFVNRLNFPKDYSQSNRSTQALFIHEMAHILQYQRRENVILKGFFLQSAYYLSFKQYDPYQYCLLADKRFEQYNIEQQGDIARDIFLKKIPNIILAN